MGEPHYPEAIEVIDSHTEGEPTRVVIDGWPRCPGDTLEAQLGALRRDFDHLRRAVICEPRGHEAMVGALLTRPVSEGSVAGVVFFNNVGYLGMCGHGLIGAVRTLADLGRIEPGQLRLDTPVGAVGAELHADRSVTIRNVPARCHALDAQIDVSGIGRVVGDIAWGGNWFFLTELPEPALELANLDQLLETTRRIRAVLDELRLVEGAEIDHIELCGPAPNPAADSRNFVLCPGGAYDRSPCGTGTSAKMAVLHARGELAIGQHWRQESITGGRFVGWLAETGGELIPYIRGRAWVTGRTTLRFDDDDPFRGGIAAAGR